MLKQIKKHLLLQKKLEFNSHFFPNAENVNSEDTCVRL